MDEAESSGVRQGLLQDEHSFPLLTELLESLLLVQEDTEQKRQAALREIEKQLQKVRNQLDPLKDSRQVALEKMGQEAWDHNPRPKMDYAERMRLLRLEQDALEHAAQVLQELNLRF